MRPTISRRRAVAIAASRATEPPRLTWTRALLAASAAAAALGAALSAARADDALIAKGKYLVTAGDCVACHSAPGGKPFAGGLYMDTPFGQISTPNLTPDKETGIGNYTDAQWKRALHQGINAKGEYLYPVFPFPWYTNVTDEDVMAIKAYLFSLEPVNAPRKPLHFAFPFNVRTTLAGWRLAFFHEGPFKPDPSKSAEVNRGAYLVTGLGHCGECHNGNKLSGNTVAAGMLKGGQIDHWYAPNITSDTADGVGSWSDAGLAEYLKTGAAPGHGVVLGPMAETVHDSLSKLSDDDIHAIVAYLKQTRPSTGGATNVALQSSEQRVPPGAQVYLSWCASCHQQNGEGIKGAVPSLNGNGAVTSGGPQNVIRVILGGVEAQKDYAPMPAFGTGMTDQQIADVTNYVRQAWGNRAQADSGPGQVGELRKITHTVLAGDNPGGCPPIKQPALAPLLAAGSPLQATVEKVDQTNMIDQVDGIVKAVREQAPTVAKSDVVNTLTLAYCPVVDRMPGATQAQKSAALGRFSVLLYTQLTTQARK